MASPLQMLAAQREFERALRFADKLSPSEKEILRLYSTGNETDPLFAFNLNGALRSGKQSEEASALEQLLRQAPRSEQEFNVWRGADEGLYGHGYRDKGFVSSTLDPEIAQDFGAGELYNFHLPRGTPLLTPEHEWMKVHQGFPQKELILPQGGLFNREGSMMKYLSPYSEGGPVSWLS